jgi:hypothetical protein
MNLPKKDLTKRIKKERIIFTYITLAMAWTFFGTNFGPNFGTKKGSDLPKKKIMCATKMISVNVRD